MESMMFELKMKMLFESHW